MVDAQINFRVFDVCRHTENLENLYLIFLGVVAASDKFDLCSEWNLVKEFSRSVLRLSRVSPWMTTYGMPHHT